MIQCQAKDVAGQGFNQHYRVPMDEVKAEISRIKFQIETTEQQLADMVKDYSVPLWRLIETKRNLKELAAYLQGLEYQTSKDQLRIRTNHEETA